MRKLVLCCIVLCFIGTSIIPGISENNSNIIYSGAIEMESLDDPPGEEWNRTFGGNLQDVGISVQQTIDGGYIISGYTSSYGAGNNDVWLIKTDGNGNKEWDKTIGDTLGDYGSSVKQTTDGGYIITGYTASYGAGGTDVWLIKTDGNGNKLWDKTFGGTENDYARCVQQTDDGGYIIAGRTHSYGAGGSDVWLIKTDSNGNKEWDKTFGGSNTDRGYSLQQTIDGGYIITGSTASYGAGVIDLWLIKTDSNGNKQWDKTYGGGDLDRGDSVQQIGNSGFIVYGETVSYSAGVNDFWLIKTDINGSEIWSKTFGGSMVEIPGCCQLTSDGGYILVGVTVSFAGDSGGDVWLIKVASDNDVNIDIGISGGFRVSAVITNNGGATTTDIEWSIDLEGGINPCW